MDIEPLIPPISEDAPCGIDFDDDRLLTLEAGNLENMVEGEIDPRDGKRLKPKWPQIQKKALELSKRGKNLRVAGILTESACVTDGMMGFRDGLRLIREWSERYWDQVFPTYDRQPLLQSLNREQVLMRPLLGVVYAPKDPSDDFDFEGFLKAWEGPGQETTEARLARLASDMFTRISPDKRAQNLSAIKDALDHAKAIEAIYDEKYGTDASINFGDLKTILARAIKLLESYENPAETDEAASGRNDSFAGPAAAPTQAGGMSRASAIAALDQVIRFFEATEPSSPVPYLLRRAQRCVGKNFMELIEELAPDRAQAETILRPNGSQEKIES